MVASLDMRSFCIIIIFPLIFDVEFRFCIYNIQRNFEYYKNLFTYQNLKNYFQIIQEMKSKPSSANKKTSNIPSKIMITKKPTIVKCFICNQMYYSQQTFDVHMYQHQKKVNKNLPQQIQRKTLQSFGIKRKQSLNKQNTTLDAINQNQLTDKIILSRTMKVPLVYGEKIFNSMIQNDKQTKITMKKRLQTKSSSIKHGIQKSIQKQQPFSKKQIGQDRQIEEINEAIRQSSLLMSQIKFLTEQVQKDYQTNQTDEVQSEEQDFDLHLIKEFSQAEFSEFVRQSKTSLNNIQDQFLKTLIAHNKSLQNCQIQIEYLRKISKFTADIKSLEKISKIKAKVLHEVINLIMVNEASQNQEKYKKNWQQKQVISEQQNLQARICSSCLDRIQFGQICTKKSKDYYHKSCFQENQN